jgi:glutaminyl-tRNA synthetase
MTNSNNDPVDAKQPPKKTVVSNFIRQLISRDKASAKYGGRVHTRFPPEPNGYLHIGHAKSICLNFSIAAENNGFCNLRFDDTNPEKESQEYVDAIKENINWLGFSWQGDVRYSSSYFDALYSFIVELIRKDKAYVCSLSPEQAREYRGSLTDSGRNSPSRDASISENLVLLEQMRAGEFENGAYSVRAKIDMASPNINMRDPVLYRIRHIEHHQTANRWCIYPTYDYTHCISDAIEGITHSLCTMEFEDHRPLYNWILENIEISSLRAESGLPDSEYVLPGQTEFAKLKLNYTMMSKRNLRNLVDTHAVSGWDDPRMPTLAGMRRRGVTPAALRNFCESVGVSRSESVVDLGMLEYSIREDLDKNAWRAMCVLRPLKIVISNFSEDYLIKLLMSNHPKDESQGEREVPLTREIYIDRADFEEIPPPGFKRLTLGGEVRLRGAYVIRCDKIIKNDQGEIVELVCTADLDTLGKKPEGRKVKGVVHWVSASLGKSVTVRLYDRLFNVENPESKDIEDYRDVLNPNSLEIIENCVVEPSVLKRDAKLNFQFEREGYFYLDSKDSKISHDPVCTDLYFNRTISLRDSWSS